MSADVYAERKAAAEARLFERIREIDPNDAEIAGAETERSHVFRALQNNWGRFPAEGVHWRAAAALLDTGPRDQALVDESMRACAEVVDLLESLASMHNCANPGQMAQLDAAMATLTSIVERVREYQGTIETWDEILAIDNWDERLRDEKAER